MIFFILLCLFKYYQSKILVFMLLSVSHSAYVTLDLVHNVLPL